MLPVAYINYNEASQYICSILDTWHVITLFDVSLCYNLFRLLSVILQCTLLFCTQLNLQAQYCSKSFHSNYLFKMVWDGTLDIEGFIYSVNN